MKRDENLMKLCAMAILFSTFKMTHRLLNVIQMPLGLIFASLIRASGGSFLQIIH